MSHHQRRSHVLARSTPRVATFLQLLASMRTRDVELLRNAFVGDQAQLSRNGDLRGVAFCVGRVEMIDRDLERREREGERPRPDAEATEG